MWTIPSHKYTLINVHTHNICLWNQLICLTDIYNTKQSDYITFSQFYAIVFYHKKILFAQYFPHSIVFIQDRIGYIPSYIREENFRNHNGYVRMFKLRFSLGFMFCVIYSLFGLGYFALTDSHFVLLAMFLLNSSHWDYDVLGSSGVTIFFLTK